LKNKILLLFSYTIITSTFLSAQLIGTYTWTGAVNTDWNTAGNWTPASVPVAIQRVVIPGSLANGNWPVLSGHVRISAISMENGSKMDFNGFDLLLENNSPYPSNSFFGATLNNSKSTGIAISFGTGRITNPSYTSFVGNVVNDNIILSGLGLLQSNSFTEDSNQFNGNVTIHITGSMSLFISNTIPSQYSGDLTIVRDEQVHLSYGGSTRMFNAGANVKGNFSFTYYDGGDTYFGSINCKSIIGGAVNIIAAPSGYFFPYPDSTSPVFSMLWLINQKTGGSITVKNSVGFNLQKDTLLLTSMSITGFMGSANGYLLNNNITGDVTIADDASYTGGWGTFVRNNTITGNCSFSNKGTNNIYDADLTGTANKYIGNVAYYKTGSGIINVGIGDFDEISQNLTLSSDAGITLGNIKFNGSSNGIVEQLGNQPIGMSNIAIEKTGQGTITLNNPVSISNTAGFTSGYIISSQLNTLLFLDNSIQTGASDASFVAGPVRKTGNEEFTFPIGMNNTYAPISITAPTLSTDAFTAQYFKANANNAGYDSTKHDLTLNHISQKEYWIIERISGTATPQLTLSWNTNRSGIVNEIPDLRVAHWNGTTWKDEGNGATTGTNEEGTIQSLGKISDFSPFTLSSASASNPLPANFLSFTATLLTNRSVLLQWKTAQENNNTRFEVERNTDGRKWIKIATLFQQEPYQYKYTDNSVIDGIVYYRIKEVGINGNNIYSIIQRIILNNDAKLVVWPNPVADILHVQTKFTKGKLQITDITGKIILEGAINNIVTAIPVVQLAGGPYVLRIIYNGNLFTSKFIKR
jgi:hypothetical protein